MTVELAAYFVGGTTKWPIEPASPKRAWMDASPGKFAYQCLPLVMANQSGWVVHCPVSFSATWNGKPEPGAIKLKFQEDENLWTPHIVSHFGLGILTFGIPYIFRTTPGYGLFVRGPTNHQVDNCVALDAIVETDWAPYSFTMNWRIMRRQTEVWFRKGDPICMVQPFPLDLPEEVQTSLHNLGDDPQLAEEFLRFKEARLKENREFRDVGSKVSPKNYMFGRRPDGTEIKNHRTNYKLNKFES